MGKQSKAFLNKEGDGWYARNYLKLEGVKEEPIGALLRAHKIDPGGHALIEYGCANGWRLHNICSKFDALGFGVDPSSTAIKNGETRYPELKLKYGTATDFVHSGFCVVIYGFCLYLADREDLFEIASVGHKSLIEGGFIVIHDFDPEYPHKIRYHHAEDEMLFSYKQDYSKLWLAHPGYKLVEKKSLGDGTALWLLHKNTIEGYPTERLDQ